MARIKLKQILSNMDYNVATNTLTVSGSSNYPALQITGSTEVVPFVDVTGSLSISGSDTFGDSISPNEIDLGTF
jgi:hypothetical protein